jgi:hypothetical protein
MAMDDCAHGYRREATAEEREDGAVAICNVCGARFNAENEIVEES